MVGDDVREVIQTKSRIWALFFSLLFWGDIGGFALQKSSITWLRFCKVYSGHCVENRLQSSTTRSKETSWEPLGIVDYLMDIRAAETSRKDSKSHDWPFDRYRAWNGSAPAAEKPSDYSCLSRPASLGGLPSGVWHRSCSPKGNSDHDFPGRLRYQLVAFLV